MSDILTFMNHRVTVEALGASQGVTQDDAGAQLQTWRPVGHNIPCYLRPLNGNESVRWGRETVRTAMVAVFRNDMDLMNGTYRVRWTQPGAAASIRTFDVQSVQERGHDETGRADYIEALLEETV